MAVSISNRVIALWLLEHPSPHMILIFPPASAPIAADPGAGAPAERRPARHGRHARLGAVFRAHPGPAGSRLTASARFRRWRSAVTSRRSAAPMPQKQTHQIAMIALRSAAPASAGFGPDRVGFVPSAAMVASSARTAVLNPTDTESRLSLWSAGVWWEKSSGALLGDSGSLGTVIYREHENPGSSHRIATRVLPLAAGPPARRRCALHDGGYRPVGVFPVLHAEPVVPGAPASLESGDPVLKARLRGTSPRLLESLGMG
jgi:hypothetical protein